MPHTGTVFEFYEAMLEQGGQPFAPTHTRIQRLGHVVLKTDEYEEAVAFFTNGSVQYFGVQDVLLVVFGNGANTDSVGPVGQQQSPIMKPMAAPGHQKKGTAQSTAKKSSPTKRHTTLRGASMPTA